MASKEQELIIKIAGKVDSSLHNAMNSIGSGIKGATKVIAGATAAAAAAIGAIGVASINVGKEFESSMSNLSATAGIDRSTAEGAESFNKLEAAAREMGRATTKTASEAADALNYMALAGWDVDTSIEALEPVLRLSEATSLDLATTSDLVTDSMSAMGITVDELSGYLDVCAAANNASNQSAEQLMEAMIGCGGAARSAGIEYQDTATALGILANNGIKGSEAGTALNSMLVRISTNSTAAKAFEEIGVAVYDTEGNMRNLQDILVDTSAALDGMSDAERNNYLSAIAGKAYYSDFQYLLNGVSDDVDGLGTSWDQLSEQIYNSEGALQAMAETKTDNLEGDLSRLTSAASDLGISIYQGINGPLREITQLGTDMMGQLSAAFDQGGFAGLAGALGGCLSQALNTLVGYLPQLVSMGVQVVGSLVEGIGQNAPQLATSAAQAVTQFITGAAAIIPQVATVGIQLILQFVQAMIPQLPQIFQAATSGIVQFIQGISANLPSIIQTGIQLIIALIQGIITSIPQIVGAAGELVMSLIDVILHTNWLEVGAEILKSIGSGILGGVTSIGGSIVNGVKSLFGGGNADVSDEGEQATESFANGIEANSGAVEAAASEVTASAFIDLDLSSITNAGMEGTEAFTLGLTDNIPLVTTAATDMTTEMNTSFETGFSTIQTTADTAMSEMSSNVEAEAKTAANAIKSAFENMTITIPKPKIPVITTSYRTETYGEGGSIQIPQFSVSWNALGGIFNAPTILGTAQGLQGVGEAGPEAVLPLDTLWDEMRSLLTDILRTGSGSGLIEALLQRLEGLEDTGGGSAGYEYAGAGGATISYSPTYNLYGSATKDDAVEAEKISQAEFARMMKQYERENSRTRF